MLDIFISKGENINIKDIIYLNIKIFFFINLILNKWRKLNQRDDAPLHYAARKNSTEIGELLIAKGVDINPKNIIYLNIIILFLINVIYNK